MAFNTLEYLEEGNVDFVYRATISDYNSLIQNVRNSERKDAIIKGFLPKLIDEKPRFCFAIIYDNPHFQEETKYLLDTYYNPKFFSEDELKLFIGSSTLLAISYLEANFEEIVTAHSKDLDFIFAALFKNLELGFKLLKRFSVHENLHIRYQFMKYLLTHHPENISLFYDDITRYLTSETFQQYEQLSLFKDYMAMPEVCELAHLAFDENNDYETWERFKRFVLANYEYNDLAYHLLKYKKDYTPSGAYRLVDDPKGIEEFCKAPDDLFATAAKSRYVVTQRFPDKISKELLEEYQRLLVYFTQNGKLDDNYYRIDQSGLDRLLATYIDKYLSLSSNQTYESIGAGTTASCYRIGDYAFKLIRTKWSYEPVICPNLYLIAPNLEEVYIREHDGVVHAGLEVQNYLSRSAKGIPTEIAGYFAAELRRLGYYTTDSLLGGSCGDNCRLLDSYLDSGNPNPPDWFKEYPLVLVDRDRVYSIDNQRPRQLRGGS